MYKMNPRGEQVTSPCTALRKSETDSLLMEYVLRLVRAIKGDGITELVISLFLGGILLVILERFVIIKKEYLFTGRLFPALNICL